MILSENKYHYIQENRLLCGLPIPRGANGRTLIDRTTVKKRSELFHGEICPKCRALKSTADQVIYR